MTAEIVSSDGRRRRADDNRRRIAAAMLSLLREGALSPSADDVAERAGVARRTVFRLFEDMEGMHREMHAIMENRLKPIHDEPLPGADWREKLDHAIERRARLYEEMAPIKSAADVFRHRSPYLQAQHRLLVQMQRDALFAIIPKSLQRQAALANALELALSFESWRRLRLEQKLSVRSAIETLKITAAKLLD